MEPKLFSIYLADTRETLPTSFTFLVFVINKCQGELYPARLIPSYLPVVAGKAGSSPHCFRGSEKEISSCSEPSFERAPACS